MVAGELPNTIRVSLGSAFVIVMSEGKIDAVPETAYLLTFRKSKCSANCLFCPQARESEGRADMLSRITWPPFPTVEVINGISRAVERGQIRRVCIQALKITLCHA